MEIFIANLHISLEEDSLIKLFEVFGEVQSAILIRDKDTKASKGYGFVVMSDATNAQRAIDDLDGREIAGKKINVKKSVPKDSKSDKEQREGFRSTKIGDHKRDSEIFLNDYEKNERPEPENIPIEVIDEMEFSKTKLNNGLIKIKFNS
jgi:RNA recognition motif-containing protein